MLTDAHPDAIIHTRITNDEKGLRRVTKKFHSYASVAYTPVVPLSPLTPSSVDDAREAFLLELASFQLSLKKSFMVCEAETRQVEEGHQSDWRNLMGPYGTREEAENALSSARERTEKWDAEERADREWGFDPKNASESGEGQ